MKRTLAILFACALYTSPAAATGGGLDAFLHDLNVHAHANPKGFAATLSSQFAVSGTEVEIVLGAVHHPADAFMIFRIGQMLRHPIDVILGVYHNHAGKGWGVMAQELGIKPGSPEFHALKRGDFHFGAPPASRGKGGKPAHRGSKRKRGH